MTLRRYTPLKPSSGTRWPPEVRSAIWLRDGWCVGERAGLPGGACAGPQEIDHVRASGGLGMKSRSTVDNGVVLCGWVHHAYKTSHGREARPLLLAYLAQFAEVKS